MEHPCKKALIPAKHFFTLLLWPPRALKGCIIFPDDYGHHMDCANAHFSIFWLPKPGETCSQMNPHSVMAMERFEHS